MPLLLRPVAAAREPTVTESRPCVVAMSAAARAAVRRVRSPRSRRPSVVGCCVVTATTLCDRLDAYPAAALASTTEDDRSDVNRRGHGHARGTAPALRGAAGGQPGRRGA